MLTSFLESAFINPAEYCPNLSTSPIKEDLLTDLPILKVSVLGGPLKDCNNNKESPKCDSKHCSKRPPAMYEYVIEPEEDLEILIKNENKLILSNYYYGNLSWLDANHMLKKTQVGTFLVRDSEHCNYLYTLSVQTRRGPTSCRIEYENGKFRLDSCETLTHKMPCFESVTDLVDHYIFMTKNLPKKSAVTPVWLDIEEENNQYVPVQIYKPLYKNVRSLQHICRVNLVRLQRELPSCSRTNDCLPTVLKTYLQEYPYPQ